MSLTNIYSLGRHSKNIIALFAAFALVGVLSSCASARSKVKQSDRKQVATKNVASRSPQTKNKAARIDYKKQFATQDAMTIAQQIKKTEGVLFSDALTLLAQKKHGQSLNVVNHLIEKFPKSAKMPKYLFLKTRIYSELNLKSQAFKSYQVLAKKYPDSHESKMAIGWIQ